MWTVFDTVSLKITRLWWTYLGHFETLVETSPCTLYIDYIIMKCSHNALCDKLLEHDSAWAVYLYKFNSNIFNLYEKSIVNAESVHFKEQ